MNVLVTSCPRSGTKYLSEVLKVNGVNAGHESVYNGLYDIKAPALWLNDNNPRVEVSWQALSAINGLTDDTFIIHSVRNPVDCINSMIRLGMFKDSNNPHWKWIKSVYEKENINYDENWSQLEKAIHFWTEWNKLIEIKIQPKVHFEKTFRVEDFVDRNIAVFFVELISNTVDHGLEFEAIFGKMLTVPKDTNTVSAHGEKKNDLKIQDFPKNVLTYKMLELADKYEYVLY